MVLAPEKYSGALTEEKIALIANGGDSERFNMQTKSIRRQEDISE
jgi:hypothetical protein